MEQAQLKHIIETGAATQAEVERYHALQEANEIAKERKAGQAGAVAEAREKAGEIPRTPEQDASAAAQGATGEPLTQIVPGYGKSASDARERVRKLTVEKIQADTGMTPEQAGIELSKRTVMWMAKKGGALQLEKMVGATDQAVAQLDFNIDKTKEEIKKLPSSDLSPVINAIIRGEQKWTGNPEYTGLFFYMYATTMESARIMSGGAASIAQLHQGAAEEARKIANVGMTPASFDVAAKSMKEEGAARLRTYREAVTGMLPEASSAPTSGAPQATPTSPKPEKYPDAVWDAKEGAWTTIFNKKKYRVKPE
jgi:general stress protein YciG